MMQDEKGRTAGNNAPMIYKALAGVIADVGSVAKDKVNRQQGFKFRSIDDVYNALHPALARNHRLVEKLMLTWLLHLPLYCISAGSQQPGSIGT